MENTEENASFYIPPNFKQDKVYTSEEIEALKTPGNKKQKNKNTSKSSNETMTENECVEKIKQYKEGIEANIVLCLYKNPELFLDCKITEDDFSYNSWKVYYIIAKELFSTNKTISEDNINFYLEQHPKLREKYDYYGGYNLIDKGLGIVHEKDFDSYVEDICKWNAILKLSERGFDVKDRLKEFADMSAEEIYDELTLFLNDSFIAVDEKVKSYNVFDGLEELNQALDAGSERGYDFIPADERWPNLKSPQILNSVINGFNINGNIYGLGACTGVGKSWMTIQMLLPLALHYNQQIVFIINEEDQKKIQQELEAWVINNVILKFKYVNPQQNPQEYQEQLHFNKKRFKEGHFSDTEKEWLRQAVQWLSAMKDKHLITVIPLERYSVNVVIKIIKKYNKLGVNLFCLDTLKESVDTRNVDTWKAMERDLVELYNVVKPASLNVGLFITYQLGKQATKLRYLTNNEVGQARNIMDVISVNLMIRKPFQDEYDQQKHQIFVHKPLKGTVNSYDKRALAEGPNYLIIFVTKNRQGETDPFQIVARVHQGYNYFEELGKAYIAQDFV